MGVDLRYQFDSIGIRIENIENTFSVRQKKYT